MQATALHEEGTSFSQFRTNRTKENGQSVLMCWCRRADSATGTRLWSRWVDEEKANSPMIESLRRTLFISSDKSKLKLTKWAKAERNQTERRLWMRLTLNYSSLFLWCLASKLQLGKFKPTECGKRIERCLLASADNGFIGTKYASDATAIRIANWSAAAHSDSIQHTWDVTRCRTAANT